MPQLMTMPVMIPSGLSKPKKKKITKAKPRATTGLVTAIATYHYVRIFNSWVDAFKVENSRGGDYSVTVSGAPFNDAYRYVDWLLTVPLLLIELILVMKLPKAETVALSWKLGLASAVMVALGYPGEPQDEPQG